MNIVDLEHSMGVKGSRHKAIDKIFFFFSNPNVSGYAKGHLDKIETRVCASCLVGVEEFDVYMNGGVIEFIICVMRMCCVIRSQVDEGIEAMLCCWLQQLQEFGGPEVDKPDLLKGSIGSLKNLGVVNASAATSTTTSTAPAVTTSNIKANVSTSGSIIKHNQCLDKRARYNVSITAQKHINLYHTHI